ncbi:MAG: ABC transporter permease [Acetobacteraceae bacterium]
MPSASGMPRAGQLGASAVLWSRALQLLLPFLIVVTEIVFWMLRPDVLSGKNIVNILQQSSYMVVFAAAQMMVMLTRGFDLSLGTAVSAVSVASALVMTGLPGTVPMGLNLAAGIAVGLAFGALVGLFNGLFVSFLGIDPFIVTLGSLNICLGIATTISGGTPVFNVPIPFSTGLATGTVFDVPVPILLAAALCVVLHFVLNGTVFGRALYIIGSNPRAARLAGLPEKRLLAAAYVVCSMLTAFGALMLTARTGSGEPTLGLSLMLESIAAAVIGGVSLRGGVGGIPQVVLGAVFVTIISNNMDLLQISGYIQEIVVGCVIVAAIFIDRMRLART